MRSLTNFELELIIRSQSLHALGRLAADFDRWSQHIATSFHGGGRNRLWFQYGAKGLDYWLPEESRDDPPHRIRWSTIRAHVEKYTPDDFRDTFTEIDRTWCRQVTEARETSDPEAKEHGNAEAGRLEDRLDELAAPIWDPAQTIDTEAEQLDLFA